MAEDASKDLEAYSLFRRALVFRDEDAWRTLYTRYANLVGMWVRRHSAFPGCGEPVEWLVNRAFEKMWAAVSEDKFTRFPDLASLLRYLQMCAHSAVVDASRRRDHAVLTEALTHEASVDPETEAVLRMERAELWEIVQSVLIEERERVLVYEAFVNGVPPRKIYERRKDLFDSVESIYTLKRNLLSRLRRHPQIQGFRLGS